MSFEALKSKTEKELNGRLNELTQENFRARFTTEAMTPARGAQMLKRRREIAQIKTLLVGRERLKKALEEQKQIQASIEKVGKPHEGSREQKNQRRKLSRKLEQLNRTVKELGAL